MDHFITADGTAMGGEESRELFSGMLDQALGVKKLGDVDENGDTVSATEFSPEVVLKAPYAPGVAVVWNNTKWLHSTTPIAIYAPGPRVMLQLNQHAHSLGANSDKYK